MNYLSLNGTTIFKRTHALVQRHGLKGLYKNTRSFVSSQSATSVCKLCGSKLKLIRNSGRSKFVRFKVTASNAEVQGNTREKIARLLSLARPERWRIGGWCRI